MPDLHEDLNLATLQHIVQAALRAWYELEDKPATRLDHLLLAQEQLARLDDVTNPAGLRRATNEVLMTALGELSAIDPQGAQILRLRFLDLRLSKEAANQLNISLDQVNRLQAAAQRRLTEIMLARELAARQTRIQTLEADLPPPQYHQLFGVEALCQRLVQQLLQPGASQLVVIVGLGGHGKTALADATARRLIRRFHFKRSIWLRVTPGGFESDSPTTVFEALIAELAQKLHPQDPAPASPSARLAQVRQALKSQPHLIVVDNLESQAELAYLLEHLPALAGPSKFLLTSRARPGGAGAAAFVLSVSELTRADAAALLRDHATVIGLNDFGALSDADVEAIYRVVGGNPLALKLVISLAAVQPLGDLLRDLEQSRTGPVEDLYRHIYLRAWETLTSPARALLQAMPLVAEAGALPEQLRALSGLSETQLWPAIQELWSRSLLEVRGTLHEKRYGIHRLTDTFLQTEIIHWPEAGAA